MLGFPIISDIINLKIDIFDSSTILIKIRSFLVTKKQFLANNLADPRAKRLKTVRNKSILKGRTQITPYSSYIAQKLEKFDQFFRKNHIMMESDE